MGYDNDESASGELFLFNPSSTTFVKHFMSEFNKVLYEIILGEEMLLVIAIQHLLLTLFNFQ